MSHNKRVCLLILGHFFSSIIILITCKELKGYTFPVYSTEFCPRNESEWKNRSSALSCNKTNGYTCLPNEKFTELLEFCYTAPFIWIQEGICLYLNETGSYLNAYNCSHFIDGCHNTSYKSRRIFDYPACISIGNGCFLAERSCQSSPNTTHHSETSEIFGNTMLLVIAMGIIALLAFFCFTFILLYHRRRRRNQAKEVTGSSCEMKHLTNVGHPFLKGTHQKDVLASHAKVEVSRSVGLIYIDYQPAGTGFRVGEKYIMTCKHVVMKVISRRPHFMDCDRVKIEFERKQYLNREDQNKIFDFQPTIKYSDDEYDVAVLELKPHVANAPFPKALECFGEVCDGEIHLVGHPGGRQMKEDSEVEPFWLPRHADIINEYIGGLCHWSKTTFPNRVDYYEHLLEMPRKIMFHTTFDNGSSGSPGFMLRNEQPCVVVMVRGGTPSCFYDNLFPHIEVKDIQKVEYGFAMSDIYLKMWNSTNSSIRTFASEIFPEWHP